MFFPSILILFWYLHVIIKHQIWQVYTNVSSLTFIRHRQMGSLSPGDANIVFYSMSFIWRTDYWVYSLQVSCKVQHFTQSDHANAMLKDMLINFGNFKIKWYKYLIYKNLYGLILPSLWISVSYLTPLPTCSWNDQFVIELLNFLEEKWECFWWHFSIISEVYQKIRRYFFFRIPPVRFLFQI